MCRACPAFMMARRLFHCPPDPWPLAPVPTHASLHSTSQPRRRSPWAAKFAAELDAGMLVLLGVAEGDTEADARQLAEKISGLRIFDDGRGKMNLRVGRRGRGHAGGEPVHPAGRLPQRPPARLYGRRRPRLGRAALPGFRRGGRPTGIKWPPAASASTWKSSWSTTDRLRCCWKVNRGQGPGIRGQGWSGWSSHKRPFAV